MIVYRVIRTLCPPFPLIVESGYGVPEHRFNLWAGSVLGRELPTNRLGAYGYGVNPWVASFAPGPGVSPRFTVPYAIAVGGRPAVVTAYREHPNVYTILVGLTSDLAHLWRRL